MNRHPPLRALIRSIIVEGPLDYWGSVAPPTGPGSQGHVPQNQVPGLRRLFDSMGHTYSIQVATNPKRSRAALQPLFDSGKVEGLDEENGVWIIRSPGPELQEYPPLANLMRRYNPQNIHILSVRPSQKTDILSPRWTVHDLIGHPLEEVLLDQHSSLEEDPRVVSWLKRHGSRDAMIELDFFPELAATLLTQPLPQDPGLKALLDPARADLMRALDSWRGSIIIVGSFGSV